MEERPMTSEDNNIQKGLEKVAKAIAFLGICILKSPASQWSDGSIVVQQMYEKYKEGF
jgi:hypothetical protein